ncbi:FkbM family methyltransferase [Synechocystis salina LEGE 06099]|uniref:FkbM family methyltransferase n=1 Tax=Synechocystis salina TaxID=945780 RepID=UPI001881C9C4|nr:FkbM family methyltransferase [Synechocystis salina]MBE9203878.1 FkbM family methyltransferase [Synechocystis salina LEGE 06099]
MFKKRLADTLRKTFNTFGLEIRLIKNIRKAQRKEKEAKEQKKYQTLAQFAISSILDIGANEGQFAKTIRTVFPTATIYSFEPLPDVYERMCLVCAEDSRIKTFNLALGNEMGIKQMFKSSFSPSSSMLTMSDLHKQEWPDSSVNTVVEVESTTLDSWIKKYEQILNDDFLIKLDVQGYELAVIQGGVSTFKKARLVIIEVSFYEFYENQSLFDDIYNCMKNLGFVYRGNLEQFNSKNDHKIIFADAIFENVEL